MDKKGVNVLYEFKSDWTELNYCNNGNDNQTISNLIEPIIQLNCIISRSVQWHIYSMCYMPYSIGIGFEKSSRKKWNLIWVFISVSIWSPYWFRFVFVMRVFLQNNRQGSTEKQIRITEREKESGATPISSVVLNNQPTWERSKKIRQSIESNLISIPSLNTWAMPNINKDTGYWELGKQCGYNQIQYCCFWSIEPQLLHFMHTPFTVMRSVYARFRLAYIDFESMPTTDRERQNKHTQNPKVASLLLCPCESWINANGRQCKIESNIDTAVVAFDQ